LRISVCIISFIIEPNLLYVCSSTLSNFIISSAIYGGIYWFKSAEQ
jgi:hypothetical protein